MSNLKVGDRVVLIERVTGALFPGLRGTIHSFTRNALPGSTPQVRIIFDGKNFESAGIFSRRFVLESVYDSPLYKVLNELEE